VKIIRVATKSLRGVGDVKVSDPRLLLLTYLNVLHTLHDFSEACGFW